MKKNHLLLLLVAMFTMFSCNYNEEQVSVNTKEAGQEAIVNGKIPLSRAISNADFIFRNTEGLGAKRRKVKGVDVLTTSNTNSHIANTRSSLNEQEEAVAYVVNYEDNDGFAILAADTKLPPVISIGDEGNFNTQGFIDFVQNRATRSNSEIHPAQEVQYAIINNSLLLPPINFNPSLLATDTTILLKCMPLVRTKWDQDVPFNYCSFNSNNEQTVAGCVPVTGAQTLASLCFHHNWRPTTQLSEDYYIDWYKINRMIFNGILSFTYSSAITDDVIAVASLIRAVGEDIGADYSNPNIVTSDNIHFIETFQKLGMTDLAHGNETSSTPVTRDDLFNMIVNKNYPIPTQASRSNSDGYGHSFILDGWLRLEYSLLGYRQGEIIIRSTSMNDNTQHTFDLVHVNFGWRGENDGYYLPDAFDLTADEYREYAEEGDIDIYKPKVYDLNVQYLTYNLP